MKHMWNAHSSFSDTQLHKFEKEARGILKTDEITCNLVNSTSISDTITEWKQSTIAF